MSNCISKLKWAWQAQFLSHTPLIFKNYLFFVDNQIILVLLFKISSGFKDTKNLILFPIQFFSHLWLKYAIFSPEKIIIPYRKLLFADHRLDSDSFSSFTSLNKLIQLLKYDDCKFEIKRLPSISTHTCQEFILKFAKEVTLVYLLKVICPIKIIYSVLFLGKD